MQVQISFMHIKRPKDEFSEAEQNGFRASGVLPNLEQWVSLCCWHVSRGVNLNQGRHTILDATHILLRITFSSASFHSCSSLLKLAAVTVPVYVCVHMCCWLCAHMCCCMYAHVHACACMGVRAVVEGTNRSIDEHVIKEQLGTPSAPVSQCK